MSEMSSEKRVDLNVLYVEPDELAQESLNHFLLNNFSQVFSAGEFASALDMLKKHTGVIDLLITEIELPDGDGLEMIEAMREIKPSLKVIITSNKVDTQTLLKAIEVGVSNFVEKPIDLNKLLALLDGTIAQMEIDKDYEKLKQKSLLYEMKENVQTQINDFVNNFDIPLVVVSEKGEIREANPMFKELAPLITENESDWSKLFLEHEGCFHVHTGDNHWPVRLFNLCTIGAAHVCVPYLDGERFYNVKVQKIEFEDSFQYVLFFFHDGFNRTESDSDTKILIADSQEISRKVIRKGLEPLDCQLFDTHMGKEAVALAVREIPNLIFMDLDMSDMSGFQAIEQLKHIPETRHIPIIVASEPGHFEMKKRCVNVGVTSFIDKPFNPQKIHDKALAILKNTQNCEKELKYFISAMVPFTEAQQSAERMTSIGRILAREMEIDNNIKGYFLYALRYLACIIEDGNYQRYDTLAKNFQMPEEFIRMLDELQNPISPEGKILKAIYESEQQRLIKKQLDQSDLEACDDALCKRIVSCHIHNTYPVFSGIDANTVWQVYYEQVNAIDNVRMKRTDMFMQLIDGVIKHQLIFGQGGVSHFLMEEEKALFIFQPNVLAYENIEAILEHLYSHEHDIYVYLGTFEDKAAIYIELDFVKTHKEEPHWEPEPLVEAEQQEEIPIAEERVVKSAVEFMAETDVDMEDVENLKNLENDIMDVIVTAQYAKNPKKNIFLIANYFKSYGTTIVYLSEFQDISSAMLELGNAFDTADYSKLEAQTIEFLPELFTKLISDLKLWRESIFIRQSAEDIHALDASIVADCKQSISFFTPQDQISGEEQEELIFF